jgi:hypothetical protein
VSKNIAASVGRRLRNLARRRNEDFGLVLTKYGLERVLFRLSRSKHRDAFVLKGALLFELRIVIAPQEKRLLPRSRMKDFHDLSSLAALFPFPAQDVRPGPAPYRPHSGILRGPVEAPPMDGLYRTQSALHRASPAGGPSVICRKLARGGTLDAVAMNALPPGVFKVIMGKIDQQKTQTYT